MADDDKKLQGDPAEAKRVLLEQAEALGMDVDKRWSAETLAEKVAEAIEDQKAEAKKAYKKEKKTPVLMIRDGFAEEDVRIRAGTVADVSLDVAKKWIDAGVAKDARPLPGLED